MPLDETNMWRRYYEDDFASTGRITYRAKNSGFGEIRAVQAESKSDEVHGTRN